MITKRTSHATQLLYSAMFALYWLPNICLALEEKVTEIRPDGTTITRETTKYYPPQTEMLSQNIIIGIVVLFGGVIALFGIKIILRALALGHKDGSAEIAIDASARTLKVKKLAQGAVVTTIGVASMLGALYFMRL